MDPTLFREILVMPNDLLKKLEWGFYIEQNGPFSPSEVVHWDKIPCEYNSDNAQSFLDSSLRPVNIIFSMYLV